MIPARVAAALRTTREPATPLCAYVYDLAAVAQRARELRAALPERTDLYYAVKANAHPEVVRTLAAEVAGFEIGSFGEARLVAEALALPGHEARSGAPTPPHPSTEPSRPDQPNQPNPLGVPNVPLAFAGPAKTDGDLAGVLRAADVQINVESAHELRRVDLAARRSGVTAKVALRVNRSGPALPGSHQMTGVASQFGVDEQQLPEVVRLAETLPGVRLCGLHLHAVSNNTDAAAHAAFVADAVAWSAEVAHRYGIELRVIDVGGGIGVDYGGGRGFDLMAFATALRGLRVPEGARLVVEPGRYLVAEAGWYAAEVVDVKRTHGRCYVMVRGGMHQFRLPSAWRMSQPFEVLPTDRWDYPWPRPQASDEPVDVAGELCTPRDVLARDARVELVRAGDVLVFGMAGAYGWEISHHDFLRHPHPRHLILPTEVTELTALL